MTVTAPPRPPRPGPSSILSRLSRVATLPAGPRSKFAVLAGLVTVVLLAAPLAGRVGDVEDNGPTSALPRSADSTKVEELLPAFDADGVLGTVVVYARDGGLTTADHAAIEADRAALRSHSTDRTVSPPTVSNDGAAATVTFGMDGQSEDLFDRFEDVRAVVDSRQPRGLEAHVTGPAAGVYDSVSVFDGLDERILAASAAVVVLLLLLTYRSPMLWAVPLASIAVAMIASQTVIYLLGEHAGLPVDGQSGGILPVLVFGVGTDYALLLIARYREELHRHADRHAAMAAAMRRAGPAILASSATVVLGLTCLSLAALNSTRSLGAVCAIGVACAAVAMMTVLPTVLVILGRWVFWPFIPRVGADAAHRSRRGPWPGVAGAVARAPRRIWIGTAVVLVGLAVTALGLDVGTTDAEKYRDAPESVVGQALLADHFPAGLSAPAEVLATPADAEEVRAALVGTPGVAAVAEPTTSPGGAWVRFRAELADAPDSAAAADTVQRMRAGVAEVSDRALVGGPTAKALDVANASARDASVVIPAVLVVVLLVLVLLLRAVTGPLILLATVLLSYVAALGAGYLTMRAMGFDAVDVALPLLAFVLLVPLGVDYTIFLMTRVREEVATREHAAGVAAGLVATGAVITSAGLVLAATFSVLTVMPIVFMIGLGVVVALGILLDTFVVRSLLVPALAIDVGPRFWWPSRRSRQR
jgi:putative drug exporter of the RND superfamily